MTMIERVELYNKKFPSHPPMSANDRWIVGFWYLWRNKKGGMYGSYPDQYLKRMEVLFSDCVKKLHLFSGTIPADENTVCYDIKPDFNPTVCDDILNLDKHFSDNEFDICYADPPYEDKDFKVYGVKKFDKGKVVEKDRRKIKNK